MALVEVGGGAGPGRGGFGRLSSCLSSQYPLFCTLRCPSSSQLKTVQNTTRATWPLRIPRGIEGLMGRTVVAPDNKLAFTSMALTLVENCCLPEKTEERSPSLPQKSDQILHAIQQRHQRKSSQLIIAITNSFLKVMPGLTVDPTG